MLSALWLHTIYSTLTQGFAAQSPCPNICSCVQAEVQHHEPHQALAGLGSDGLHLPRSCCSAAARLLAPRGFLGIEVGGACGCYAGKAALTARPYSLDRDRACYAAAAELPVTPVPRPSQIWHG